MLAFSGARTKVGLEMFDADIVPDAPNSLMLGFDPDDLIATRAKNRDSHECSFAHYLI
jgi:hypothetical protein